MRRSRTLAAIVLLTVHAGVVAAAELHVPSEYATIGDALTAAEQGDAVMVASGTYEEPGGIEITPGISLVGVSAAATIVETPWMDVAPLQENDSTPLVIEGVHFREVGPMDVSMFFGIRGNPLATIRACAFTIFGSITFAGGGTFEYNVVEHTDWTRFHTFSTVGDYNYGTTGSLAVRHNVISLTSGGMALDLDYIENATYDHNTFVFAPWPTTSAAVAVLAPEDADVVFSNNIFWGLLYSCHEPRAGGSMTFENNCFFPYAAFGDHGPCPPEPPDGTNFEADPEFCAISHPDDLDYRLMPGSPCEGAGSGGSDIGALAVGCAALTVGADNVGPGPRVTVTPLPSAGSVGVVLSMGRAADASVHLFGPSGNQVRTLFSGWLPAGESSFSWDGRDALGARMPSGVYFVRIRSAGREASVGTARVVLIR